MSFFKDHPHLDRAGKHPQEIDCSAEFRLQLALEAAGMLSWDWFPAAESVTFSRDYGEFFGLAPENALRFCCRSS